MVSKFWQHYCRGLLGQYDASSRPCLSKMDSTGFLTERKVCLTRCEGSFAQQWSETSCYLFLTNWDIPGVWLGQIYDVSSFHTISLSAWTRSLSFSVLLAASRHILTAARSDGPEPTDWWSLDKDIQWLCIYSSTLCPVRPLLDKVQWKSR